MKDYEFHHRARSEFEKAAIYYEVAKTGLARRFITAVQKTINSVRNNPLAYPVIKYDVRKAIVNDFPYSILYTFDEETIRIIAVMHQRRRPSYWTRRIHRQ